MKDFVQIAFDKIDFDCAFKRYNDPVEQAYKVQNEVSISSRIYNFYTSDHYYVNFTYLESHRLYSMIREEVKLRLMRDLL